VIGDIQDFRVVGFDLRWVRHSGKIAITNTVVDILDITGFLG